MTEAEKPKRVRKPRKSRKPPFGKEVTPGSPDAPVVTDRKAVAVLGRPTNYDPSWMLEKVIEVGKRGGSLTEMGVAIGVYHRETLYQWAMKHPAFNDALKAASALSQAWWEEQGRIATFGGYENFSAASYIFQMKNRFPHSWRDVRQNEVSGPDGGALTVEGKTIDARRLTSEQREALKTALLAATQDDDEGEE